MSQIEDNKDIKALIKHVLGSQDGKRLLNHLFEKNVNTTIACESVLQTGIKQGKSDLIRQLKNIVEND